MLLVRGMALIKWEGGPNMVGGAIPPNRFEIAREVEKPVTPLINGKWEELALSLRWKVGP